ncbi:MAG: division/cell wall cluster transcriptional repressor MraZ [Candidatus Aminicenantales bacterium]
MGKLLIGSAPARVDNSGRIKIPERFRSVIEQEYGREVFITSLTDESIQLFPLPVWEKLTGCSIDGATQLQPEIYNFLRRVNRKGFQYQIDSKGRVLISQQLRNLAQLKDDVEVLGLNNHLEIWNRARLDEKLEKGPLTDADFKVIANLLPGGKRE